MTLYAHILKWIMWSKACTLTENQYCTGISLAILIVLVVGNFFLKTSIPCKLTTQME